MGNINNIVCAENYKNVGRCDCNFDPKNIVGGFLAPIKKVFADGDLNPSGIQALLEGLAHADKKDRIYPLPPFVTMTDSSEDVVEVTYGFGGTERVRDGNYKWLFRFRDGGIGLNNAMRSFNGAQSKYGVIFFDANGVIIGTKVSGGMAPIKLTDLYTKKWKANDGKETAMYETMFNFTPEQINENIAYVEVPQTTYLLSELNGLLDVNLTVVSSTNTSVTVSMKDACGNNLYDDYSGEFAAAARFKVINTLTGNDIAITSVVAFEPAKGWKLTLDTSDADMPATGASYKVSLKDPATLYAADIVGFEGANTLTVVRVASTVATLAGFTTTNIGAYSPSFDPATTSYTATTSSSSTTITPNLTEPHATVKVNNVTVANGAASGSISLTTGANTITIVVTAEDGTTTKTYTLVVTKS
jgi:hypothetical protein